MRSLCTTLALFAAGTAGAQQFTISTLAGSAVLPSAVPASSVGIPVSFGLVVNSGGDVYFTSSNAVMKLGSDGILTRIAGTGAYGVSPDGAAAPNAQLAWPAGLALDGSGNLYIAENAAHRVRKVSPQGTITTVAGTGAPGYSGDGGSATAAQLNWPVGLALDASGNLFIADTGNKVIRKVASSGTISTVAMGLNYNEGIAVDSTGNLYAADYTSDGQAGYVLKITPAGISSQIMGPDDLGSVAGIAVDPAGDILVADPEDGALVKLTAQGTISFSFFNGGPNNVASDSSGNLYLSRNGAVITRISVTGGMTGVVGSRYSGNYWGDGGQATAAGLDQPTGVAVDISGNLYISDSGNNRVRRVSADGSISTFAGTGINGFSGDGGPASAAQLGSPSGLALDSAGNLYIADWGNHRVRSVSEDGTITTVAGGGTAPGDGGPATSAVLDGPFGLTIDASGNLYIADDSALAVRKVSPSGIISTVAASTSYLPGPNQIGYPIGVAVDSSGNVYVSSSGFRTGGPLLLSQGQVYKVSAAGAVSTIAGVIENTVAPPSGDGGLAINAVIRTATGVVLDAAGNLWISGGSFNGGQVSGYVQEITPDGIIHTIVGNGTVGDAGDGGPASAGLVSSFIGPLTIDPAGNIYFADIFNNAVRVLKH